MSACSVEIKHLSSLPIASREMPFSTRFFTPLDLFTCIRLKKERSTLNSSKRTLTLQSSISSSFISVMITISLALLMIWRINLKKFVYSSLTELFPSRSIMHYTQYSFSIEPWVKPVFSLLPGVDFDINKIGTGENMSDGDVLRLNRLYKCPPRP